MVLVVVALVVVASNDISDTINASDGTIRPTG